MSRIFHRLTNFETQNIPNEYDRFAVSEIVSADESFVEAVVTTPSRRDNRVTIAVNPDVVHATCDCKSTDTYCSHIVQALNYLDWTDFPWPRGNLTLERLKRSGWRLAFHSATARSKRESRLPTDPQLITERLYYIIDLELSAENGCLTVDVAISKLNRRGQWGKPVVKSIENCSSRNISPQDARAVELLRNLATPFSYSVELPAAMYSEALRVMAETSELYWSLEGTDNNATWQRLTWTDKQWEAQINVEAAAPKKGWRIQGEFQCEDETRQFNEAVLVLKGGELIFVDEIGSFADPAIAYPWVAALRTHGDIYVPAAETQDMLEELMGNTADFSIFRLPPELQYNEEQGSPTPRARFGKPQRGSRALPVDIEFLYRGEPASPHVGMVDHEQRLIVRRDLEAEAQCIGALEAAKVTPARPSGYELLTDDLPNAVARLSAAGWVVEADGKVLRRSGGMNIAVKSGVDWFDLDGVFQFDDQQVSFPKVLSAMRRGDKFVALDDGSHGLLPEEWLEKFSDVAHLGEADGDSLRFSMPQAALLDALLDAQDNVQLDAKYQRYREKLHSFSGVEPIEPHKKFKGELRAYQKDGLGWIKFLQEFGLGGCLADDMGLGKTIQVLSTLQADRAKRPKKGQPRLPSLIVVPRSLLFNWIAEAKRFTPELKVMQYFGQQRKELLDDWDDQDIIVTTYGIVRRDIQLLMEKNFHYVVLDEAQAIKNNSSQSAKACRLLNARHRLALTGTPVENHLGELWSLFEFLNPGLLGRNEAFMSLARSAKQDSSAQQMIARGIRPFVLRRTKQEVLTDLPLKTEQTIFCEMDTKQRAAYDELREYYRQLLSNKVAENGLSRSKIHVLEALLRLRQCACHPKLLDTDSKIPSAKFNALFDNLDSLMADGHKALIFSQFTKLLAVVRQELDERGVPYEYLDGRTRRREDRVKAFQENPDCPLFLISLKAGGHGLNLTAADYVFILDPWWNPAVEAQAVDRVHRIGQDKPVFAYRLICKDTVEEKILQLQGEKRDLANAIINADNSLMRDLTADDLAVLLS